MEQNSFRTLLVPFLGMFSQPSVHNLGTPPPCASTGISQRLRADFGQASARVICPRAYSPGSAA